MANQSIYAAFQRMWQHVTIAIGGKANAVHTHDDMYYTEAEIDSKLESKADKNHTHNDLETKTDATNKLGEAKSYTDEKIALLMNNSSEAIDSIMELATAMEENEDVVKALEDAIGKKADADDLTSHTENTLNPHNVTKAQVGLGDVENKSSATIRSEITKSNVTTALGYTPYTPTEVDNKLSEKAAKTDLDTHVADTTKHITSTERTNWNTAKTHADSAHAPSNAQANVIESIKVNGAAQTITSKSVNITVPTDNSQLDNGAGYITSSAIANKADKATTLSGYGITNAYTKSEVDSMVNSKASSTHNHEVADITDLTATATELNYMDGVTSNVQAQLDEKATTSALTTHVNNTDIHFTAAERTKLSGIDTGANKTVVDTALSSTSTNPVQNKVINSAISTATSAIKANTDSITTHTSQISDLQTAVSEIQEITSAEIQALFA